MTEPDLDLRVVRYFVGVAEHGGFGRASVSLRVGQPSLSRQIRSLEGQLGVRLFDRTAAGARLTAAGEAFLPKARELLRIAHDAIALADGRPGRITVGHAPGLDVAPAVRELRRRRPGAQVRTAYLGWHPPHEALLGGAVDVAVARRPLRSDALLVEGLRHEPRFLALHRDHPLARRSSLGVEDLAEVPLPDGPGDDECRRFWRLEPRPGGAAAVSGPPMASLDEAWQLVAQGDIGAVVSPDHARAAGPDTVLVPLRDVAPSEVVLAVRADDRSRLVEDFRMCARHTLSA